MSADRRLWTPEEDVRLLALKLAGRTHQVIAAELGRATSSVASRLKTLKLPSRAAVAAVAIARPAPAGQRGVRTGTKDGGPGERKVRPCMCCKKSFYSAHAGNRLCRNCSGKSVSPYAPG